MELFGRMGRALSIMKVRGSQHSKDIREFEITAQGIRIGEPVQVMTGVMTGTPVVREDGYLQEIPGQVRYIVEAMTRRGAMTLQQLQEETGLNRDRLEEELGILQQQGIVLALDRDDGQYYRTTM